VLNYPDVTRRHNWIPAEYGYNMLVSCTGEKAVIFTNGDNDTFPLWFMQTVPSRVAGLDPEFGKNVAVANLSLLNTNWYCKQLKRWGAPISFSEEEIDKLPQGFVGKDGRTFLLKDVMMRDIVATSGGVRLKWPDDYGSTSEEYIDKVFRSGRWSPRTPVYFATTVSSDNLQDFKGWMILEGLVNRVIPRHGDNLVDAEKTYNLLFNVYKMKSMVDPSVSKDDNTRGLLINYAASYLALANEFQRLGRNREAQEVLTRAMEFELDDQRRVPLFYHLSIFAMLNQDYENALAYIDSISALGFDDPELMLRRGLAYQAMGRTAEAEAAYLEAVSTSPNRPEPVQALYKFYLEETFDTVKARRVLEQWLKRMPSDSVAGRMLKEIS
jgi:tetratricopeptide (TPR) repeat protein